MEFDRNDAEQVAAIQSMLMQKAAAARESPADFLEFVMREQVSRRPLKCAPHQRVGLDFVMAHPRSVQMWPAGSSKTYTTVALTLFLLGRDPTTRGAIFSSIQAQAKKTVSVVTDYIGASPDLGSRELRLVFPQLRRSGRRGDPWRDDAIVVDRPAGIPDPSLVAVGIDGGALGSRLNWIVVDDILSRENTATADQRKKVLEFFYSTILTRLDPVGGRVIVNNTAWHPDDLVHYLSDPKRGKWPSLKMTITGDIEVGDDPRKAARGEFWDHPLLRPKFEDGPDMTCRLARPGIPDPNNDVPLFPERFFFLEWELPDGSKLPPANDYETAIERARVDIENKHHEFAVAGEFNRAFMNQARDDASAQCKAEWIEFCKKAGRDAKHFGMVERYEGTNATFTGVDLAVSPGEESDDCAFFTFEVMNDRRRKILDIEVGKFDGPTIIRKLISIHERYNSILRVENNSSQDFIRQFALDLDKSLPIKPHCTGRTKAHPEHGVPGIFAELSNAAWLIPNDANGNVHPHVQRWINGCLYYVPAKHTDDILMASYFAREQAKKWGLLAPPPKNTHGRAADPASTLVSGILSR